MRRAVTLAQQRWCDHNGKAARSRGGTGGYQLLHLPPSGLRQCSLELIWSGPRRFAGSLQEEEALSIAMEG